MQASGESGIIGMPGSCRSSGSAARPGPDSNIMIVIHGSIAAALRVIDHHSSSYSDPCHKVKCIPALSRDPAHPSLPVRQAPPRVPPGPGGAAAPSTTRVQSRLNNEISVYNTISEICEELVYAGKKTQIAAQDTAALECDPPAVRKDGMFRRCGE